MSHLQGSNPGCDKGSVTNQLLSTVMNLLILLSLHCTLQHPYCTLYHFVPQMYIACIQLSTTYTFHLGMYYCAVPSTDDLYLMYISIISQETYVGIFWLDQTAIYITNSYIHHQPLKSVHACRPIIEQHKYAVRIGMGDIIEVTGDDYHVLKYHNI